MKQGNGARRKGPSANAVRANQPNGADMNAELEVRALEALLTAYKRLSRVLSAEIDRSRKDIDIMSDLGGRLRWVSERHSMVRTALAAGPGYAAYLCGECEQLPAVHSLAQMAAKIAHDDKAYPTALNLLNYIDHELGWKPVAKSA